MGKIKLKTHKGTKKSLTKRNSGSVKFKKPGAGHLTGKYSADRNRFCTNRDYMGTADAYGHIVDCRDVCLLSCVLPCSRERSFVL